jgi:hypothetical protein
MGIKRGKGGATGFSLRAPVAKAQTSNPTERERKAPVDMRPLSTKTERARSQPSARSISLRASAPSAPKITVRVAKPPESTPPAPPKGPPKQGFLILAECEEKDPQLVDLNTCEFHTSKSNPNLLLSMVRRVLQELLSNPLKIAPVNFMLVELMVGFVIDELALIAKNHDDEVFRSLLKIALSTTLNTPRKSNLREITIRFATKQIRDALNLYKLDQIMKKYAYKQIEEIKYNVRHRLELHTMHLQ